ncbi:MAG: phosphoribosylglycinamide formyltransferase [Thaumarchaeota archaeon]|nr:phosphoribosylglycinamide formyltransferase [Nitrososphaerota archaeon]MDE1830849.1 phosphoribosylglycinamide formyltransferase [Nitrososphaerota archaeon]MDE1840443.1 phosphoribosylglycinamide formyltransferase [Nitrososphaerota archaeon]MDE1876953.1 phosphoribosylglycinamide formyltransferase [Nitrososphaerota archaeon]
MLNLAILISGRGSNMENILKAVKKNKIPIRPVIVISNKPDARGLAIAQKIGIMTESVDSNGFKGGNWEYDSKLVSVLEKYGVTPQNGLICLAGFMRIMSPEFIRHYKGRIMNIHPAILPAFPGLHSQRQALEYGVKYSGCTVHFVDEGVDTGPIILQSVVKIKDDDTEESISKKILKQEHKIYPKAVKLFSKGKIKIVGRKTVIS